MLIFLFTIKIRECKENVSSTTINNIPVRVDIGTKSITKKYTTKKRNRKPNRNPSGNK